MDEELRTIIIASIVLGIVFSIADIRNAQELFGLLVKAIKFFLIAFISLLFHNFIQKKYAKHIGATTKLVLWDSKKKIKFFRKEMKFPLGIFLPPVISLLSAGQIIFASATSTEIEVHPSHRLGRKFVSLTEFELS